MRFISLGKIDKNLLSVLIGCVICFLNRLYDETFFFKNITSAGAFISSSQLFTFIPHTTFKRRTNKVTTSDTTEKSTKKIEFIYINQLI